MNNNFRGSEIQEFLTRAGWGEASRTPLNQGRVYAPLRTPAPQDRDVHADGRPAAGIPTLPAERNG